MPRLLVVQLEAPSFKEGTVHLILRAASGEPCKLRFRIEIWKEDGGYVRLNLDMSILTEEPFVVEDLCSPFGIRRSHSLSFKCDSDIVLRDAVSHHSIQRASSYVEFKFPKAR